MPWTIKLHSDSPIIETIYSGMLTPAELFEAAKETLALLRSHDRRLLLAECTTLEGGHSVIDLYEIADFFAASGIAGSVKEAVLLPVSLAAAENVEFWENTCFNRCIKVRVFNNRESALAWLLEK